MKISGGEPLSLPADFPARSTKAELAGFQPAQKMQYDDNNKPDILEGFQNTPLLQKLQTPSTHYVTAID